MRHGGRKKWKSKIPSEALGKNIFWLVGIETFQANKLNPTIKNKNNIPIALFFFHALSITKAVNSIAPTPTKTKKCSKTICLKIINTDTGTNNQSSNKTDDILFLFRFLIKSIIPKAKTKKDKFWWDGVTKLEKKELNPIMADTIEFE